MMRFNIIFILFCILLFIIFLLPFIYAFPFEARGINNELIKIPLDIYNLDSNLSKKDVNEVIDGANDIWRKYNFYLKITNITFSTENLSFQEVSTLFNTTNCIIIQPIINKIVKQNNSHLKLLLLSGSNLSSEGRAYICSNDFIILDSKKIKWLSWNLAHELGHTLNAKSSCFKWNLMIELGGNCPQKSNIKTLYQLINWGIIKSFKPEFLTQQQIDNAKIAARNFQ